MTPIFNNVVYLNQNEVSSSPFSLHVIGPLTCSGSVVAIPVSWTLGIECARISKINALNNKLSIYTKSEQFTSGYLASIFNSNLGLRFLLGGTVRKMQTVHTNKNEVIKVPIFKSDISKQKHLGDLQLLIQGLYENRNDGETRIMIDIFENVRDGLILELYFQDTFKQRGISIWKSWNDTIMLHSLSINIENVEFIYNSIRGLSSAVRNSLKSIQILKNSPSFKF